MFFTWNPTNGAGWQRRDGSLAEAHGNGKPAVPTIASGPYAGSAAAQEAFAEPAYDPNTQRLGEPTPDGSWPVLELTQAEIDARAEAEADEIERQQAKAAYVELSKIVAGTTTLTAVQCDQLFARILRRLILEHFGKPDPEP